MFKTTKTQGKSVFTLVMLLLRLPVTSIHTPRAQVRRMPRSCISAGTTTGWEG